MSKIGHNKPPKDREQTWKTISINIWSYKDLERIRDYIQEKRDASLMKGRVTIPMAIEIMAAEYWLDNILPHDMMIMRDGINMNKEIKKLNKQLKKVKKDETKKQRG